MAEYQDNAELSDVPEARTQPKKRWSFQIVWLIPIVSALIGGYVAVKAILDKGPEITIRFHTAEGLEAGKTKLKYKDVEVGLVKTVSFSKDLKDVIATAELVKQAGPRLVEDTRFWVVRPRISGGSVSGLGTLLSGSYIAVDVGKSTKQRRDFVGLEEPPVVSVNAPGREFVLRSASLASVDAGSPVFFRRLQAGQVMSYALDDDGKGVTMRIFVNAPYDRYVNSNTRFWNASGIDMKLDASGVSIETESLVSILIGGIAFETPEQSAVLAPAAADARYTLYANRTDAMKNPETDVVQYVAVFNESARGLTVGAPVDFRGIVLGEVTAVHVDIDSKLRQIVVPVEIKMYPDRLRQREREGSELRQTTPEARRRLIDVLVANGLRAQLRSGSLLTGALYIALDFFPNASKASVNWTASMPEIPTTPGAMQGLQTAIASVAAKIDRFPLDKLGKDASSALVSADRLLKSVHSDVTPDLRHTLQSGTKLLQRLDIEVTPEARDAIVEARKTLVSADRLLSSDAPLQTDTREAMREIARAAHAFRTLADYIERHPESVLMGKKED